MDFDLDADEWAVLDALGDLLVRHAGPARARQVQRDGGYDRDLSAALDAGGYLDVFGSDDGGPLLAALVVERVARAAGAVPVGASALVAPALLDGPVEGEVALTLAGSDAPVRFGAQAKALLIVGDGEARIRPMQPGEAEPVPTVYGYPLARVPADGGESLGPGSDADLLRWWRLALAAEAVGTMGAAFDLTVQYVKERHQFGRPIGSFQAVQHRLAEAAVSIEGARWLCYEAAWQGAPPEAAAIAATAAVSTARELTSELHQLTGSVGFTTDYDLQLWSMRLVSLRTELEGVRGHARAVSATRWS